LGKLFNCEQITAKGSQAKSYFSFLIFSCGFDLLQLITVRKAMKSILFIFLSIFCRLKILRNVSLLKNLHGCGAKFNILF